MIFLICGRYDTMMCLKKCQSDEDVFYLMIDPFVVICSLLVRYATIAVFVM